MNRNVKIMFCINTLGKGGAERVVVNLANKFSAHNSVSIMVLQSENLAYEINDKVKVLEIENKVKKNHKKRTLMIKLTDYFKKIIRTRRILKKEKPDVIVTFLPVMSFLVLISKFRKNKVVVSVRNDPRQEYESKKDYIFMKLLYPKADGFIFQTNEAKEYFKNILKCKQKVIPNSINPAFIVDKPYCGERKKEIVSVGRLCDQKNHEILIRAFAEFSKKYDNYVLKIYGEGQNRTNLEKLVKELDIEEKVFMPGVIDDVKENIYDVALFVLPSKYEGMPNALIEAMVLGLPVISTDCPCGGPRDLIENNVNGILVSVDDQTALFENMIKVISDNEFALKLSHNAVKLVEVLHPDRINKMWWDFLEDVYEK